MLGKSRRSATSRIARSSRSVQAIGLALLAVLAIGAASASAFLGGDPECGYGYGYGGGSGNATCSPAAPHAEFTVTPANPHVGSKVRFYADNGYYYSSGGTTWAWDFDANGTVDSRVAAPTHTFTSAGLKTVKLTVTDQHGRTATSTQEIKVSSTNTAPSVSYYSTPQEPRAGQRVDFQVQAYDGDGRVAALDYDWDGDGTYDESSFVSANSGSSLYGVRSHTYAAAGDYTPQVRVTDDEGKTGVYRSTVSVHAGNLKPTVQFNGAVNGAAGLKTVSTQAIDPDGTIAHYDLDFGDGSGHLTDPASMSYVSAQHTYAAGDFVQAVTVTDDSGATTTIHRTVHITAAVDPGGNHAPQPDIYLSTSAIRAGTPVYLYQSENDPDSGDFTFTYAWSGDADTHFDDTTIAYPHVTFDTAGDHDVTLAVTDEHGATGTSTVTYHVSEGDQAPDVQASAPSTVRTGKTGHVSFYAYDDGTIAQVQWDLDGDGAYDDDTVTPPYASSYYSDGRDITFNASHEVGIKVTDDTGHVGVSRVSVDTTDENLAPVADFSYSPSRVVKDQPVDFDAYAYDGEEGSYGFGGGVTYAWDLDGDNQFDDDATASPQHTFTTLGKHTVSLKVTDTDNLAGEDPESTIVRREITVGTQPPTATLALGGTTVVNGSDQVAAGSNVTFTPTASDPDNAGALTYDYDFGEDGSDRYNVSASGNGATTHAFAQPGSYLVRLRVKDADGDITVVQKPIQVTGSCTLCLEYVDSTAYQPVVGQTVTYSAQWFTTPPAGVSYAWDTDDDGLFDDGTGATLNKAWSTSGLQRVRLKVTNGGATAYAKTVFNVDEESSPPYVYVFPTAPGRTGQPVTFEAEAGDPNDDPITNYEWDVNDNGKFNDPVDQSGPALTSISKTYATAGTYHVNLRVTADHNGTPETGDGTSSVVVTTENQAPSVYAYAQHSTSGVNQDVKFSAYAYDYDGTIAKYEWDLNGDNDYTDAGDQSGAALSTVTKTGGYATPGTYTVHVRVTDNEGKTGTAAANITVTDGSAKPQVFVYHYPDPVEAGKKATFYASVYDPDGDDPASIKWDLDADGSFEQTGTSRAYVLADAGAVTADRQIKVTVTDPQGNATEVTTHFAVVSSPPSAEISGPAGADKGDPVTFSGAATGGTGTLTRQWAIRNADSTYTDLGTASTQDRTFSAAGTYVLRLTVTDADGVSAVDYHTIVVREPQDISIPVVPPVTAPGQSEPVHITETVNPATGGVTIQVPNSTGVWLYPSNCMPLDVQFKIRHADGSTVSNLTLSYPGATPSSYSGSPELTGPDGTGTYTAHVSCIATGELKATYDVTPAGGGSPDHFTDVPVAGIQLIDPQGVVYDGAAYEAAIAALGHAPSEAEKAAARDDAAIAGATVTLQRKTGGTWSDVSASDPGISPNVNPQVTGADGLYQWDVSAGDYRVVVKAAGYRAVTTDMVTVPPPVTDLHVPMFKNAAPKAAATVPATAQRNKDYTLTSTSTDDDGSIASVKWDTDNDGAFDDATGTTAHVTFTTLGTKTVKALVEDDSGATDTVTKTIQVANVGPSAGTVGASPASPTTGQEVTFTSSGASDADTATAVTKAWDTDGDGQYDDGAGNSVKATYATAGARTVKVQVTDGDGATATATKDVTVSAPAEVTPTPTTTPGTGSTGGTGGGGPTSPKDTTAPGLTVAAAKQAIKAVLKSGLKLKATCTEACSVKVSLYVDAKTAKALKLGKKKTLVGSGSATGGTITVKLSAKAKKALKKAKAVKLSAVTIATDAAGNASAPVTKAVSLKK